MSEKNQNKGAAYRQSVIVAIVLAILTVIEYFVAIELHSAILLMLIALFKAVIVIRYYMHVQRLWQPEEEH